MNVKGNTKTNPRSAADTSQHAPDFVPLSADPRILDMLAKLNARREAERAAVLNIKSKGELSKGDLVRVFQEERAAIESLLKNVETAFDFALAVCKKKTKEKETRESWGEAANAVYYLEDAKDIRGSVREHLRAIWEAIQKT